MLEIEIVYGLPDKQVLKKLNMQNGCTVREAVCQSGLDEIFSELDLRTVPLGIFGKSVKDETLLRDKDRIEIYRPLLIDPKEARRKRVQNQD
ncbi:RnfH family protein [Neisseria sicca]|jgi:protein rnfH|uniref:RnfH family protein n=1 Tax=Neisseria sicca TaxID=490 RepID=UPI000D31321B|nr:RnfH family protein [Neisseria sicca]MBF1285639.1 RnfH family protein [Neisseria sp.]